MGNLNQKTRSLPFVGNVDPTLEATTTEGGEAERGGGATIGKIGGRRVRRVGDQLIIPNTPQGRALATLLTGATFRNGYGRVKRFALHLDRCTHAAEILPLLSAILATTADTGDASGVRKLLEDHRIHAAESLSRDPWITVDRVMAWIVWCSDPDNIRDSVDWRAILVIKLRDHIEPPLTGIEEKLFLCYGETWRDHPDAPKTRRERLVFTHFGKSWFDYQDSI
jgi:hypothetical protein